MKTIDLQDSDNLPSGLVSFEVADSFKAKPFSTKFSTNLISKNITKTTFTSGFGSQKEIQKTKSQDPKKESNSIRNYFLRLLAKRDYSESEFKQKAKFKDFNLELVDQVIEDFKAKKWLDDERFAQNLIDVYKGQKGKSWIMQKLAQKGIASSIVRSLFEVQNSIVPDQNVRELLERKHKILDWKSIDIKVKNKVMYFLSSRGFSNAFAILKQWQDT
jgi:regulatory protein